MKPPIIVPRKAPKNAIVAGSIMMNKFSVSGVIFPLLTFWWGSFSRRTGTLLTGEGSVSVVLNEFIVFPLPKVFLTFGSYTRRGDEHLAEQ